MYIEKIPKINTTYMITNRILKTILEINPVSAPMPLDLAFRGV